MRTVVPRVSTPLFCRSHWFCARGGDNSEQKGRVQRLAAAGSEKSARRTDKHAKDRRKKRSSDREQTRAGERWHIRIQCPPSIPQTTVPCARASPAGCVRSGAREPRGAASRRIGDGGAEQRAKRMLICCAAYCCSMLCADSPVARCLSAVSSPRPLPPVPRPFRLPFRRSLIPSPSCRANWRTARRRRSSSLTITWQASSTENHSTKVSSSRAASEHH